MHQMSVLSQNINIFEKRQHGIAEEVGQIKAKVVKILRRAEEIMVSQHGSIELLVAIF